MCRCCIFHLKTKKGVFHTENKNNKKTIRKTKTTIKKFNAYNKRNLHY